MRSISPGLIAAGLAALIASSASAGFSGRAGGFLPFPMGHHGFGGPHQHFVGVPSASHFDHDFRFRHLWFGRNGCWRCANYPGYLYSPIISGFDSQPTDAAPNLANLQIILAPAYVPPAPVARTVSSGPRIIVIGAQPKETLPVVVYGASPDRLN